MHIHFRVVELSESFKVRRTSIFHIIIFFILSIIHLQSSTRTRTIRGRSDNSHVQRMVQETRWKVGSDGWNISESNRRPSSNLTKNNGSSEIINRKPKLHNSRSTFKWHWWSLRVPNISWWHFNRRQGMAVSRIRGISLWAQTSKVSIWFLLYRLRWG